MGNKVCGVYIKFRYKYLFVKFICDMTRDAEVRNCIFGEKIRALFFFFEGEEWTTLLLLFIIIHHIAGYIILQRKLLPYLNFYE